MSDVRWGEMVVIDDALTDGVLWRRVVAWVIDAVLIGVIMTVLWVVLGLFGVLTLGLGLPLLGVLPIIPVLYHVLFIAGGRTGTPGERWMDLTVRRDLDLGPPSLFQAVLFTAGLWITLSLGAIWLAAALFTSHKRTLHDLLSSLVIVRREQLTRNPGLVTMPG